MQRAVEKDAIETQYQTLLSKTLQLNSLYRNESKGRIQVLNTTFRAQREEMSTIWGEREKYRIETEERNASLNALLKRGKDAKSAAATAEIDAETERLKQEAKNSKKKK
jgi:hypothetical protein